jgi:hypothetical protein
MQILYHCKPLADENIQHFFQSYSQSYSQAHSAASDVDAMKARLPLVQVYHHFRFAAYCAYRITHLQASQQAVAALYNQALSAELDYLNHLLENK